MFLDTKDINTSINIAVLIFRTRTGIAKNNDLKVWIVESGL